MQKKYFKNLDATRFIAFLVVFSEHIFVSINGASLNDGLFQQTTSFFKSFAFLGLEYFFVLSSFLITWIALEEYNRNHFFNASNFIFRRALRVWPLYFLIVLIAYFGGAVFQYFFNGSINSLPPIGYFLTFTVNFFTISHGTEYLFFLVFLWSISIEEQFYILWSIILKFLINYLKHISFALVIISIVFRAYYHYVEFDGNILFFHTLSIIGNFGVGSLAALFCFNNSSFFQYLSFIPKSINYFIYLSFFCLIFLYAKLFSTPFMQIIERLVFSCYFAYFIIEQSYNTNSILKFGRIPLFNYLGKISYGMYCFHGIVITILIKGLNYFNYKEKLIDSLVLYPLIVFCVTLLISVLSFKYFESWFLRKKKKFY